jgi:HEAT repeat protein
LDDALANPDPTIRIAAAQALGFFGLRAKASAPKLLLLSDPAHEPDDRVRHAATDSLQKIAPGEIPAPSTRKSG